MKGEEFILKQNLEITSADSDRYGRLRIGALLNFLIQAAGKSADQLSFGYEDLKKQNCFWVLNRMEIILDEIPHWQDNIFIETWPKTIEKLFYLRDFFIRNASQKIIGKASSRWLVINAERRRPTLLKEFEASFADLKDYHALAHTQPKLPEVKGELTSERMVTYTDVDVNQHLTSVRYADWIMDSLSLDFHEKNYPKHFAIEYHKETRPEESLEIIQHQEHGTLFFEGKNLQSGKCSFRAMVGG